MPSPQDAIQQVTDSDIESLRRVKADAKAVVPPDNKPSHILPRPNMTDSFNTPAAHEVEKNFLSSLQSLGGHLDTLHEQYLSVAAKISAVKTNRRDSPFRRQELMDTSHAVNEYTRRLYSLVTVRMKGISKSANMIEEQTQNLQALTAYSKQLAENRGEMVEEFKHMSLEPEYAKKERKIKDDMATVRKWVSQIDEHQRDLWRDLSQSTQHKSTSSVQLKQSDITGAYNVINNNAKTIRQLSARVARLSQVINFDVGASGGAGHTRLTGGWRVGHSEGMTPDGSSFLGDGASSEAGSELSFTSEAPSNVSMESSSELERLLSEKLKIRASTKKTTIYRRYTTPKFRKQLSELSKIDVPHVNTAGPAVRRRTPSAVSTVQMVSICLFVCCVLVACATLPLFLSSSLPVFFCFSLPAFLSPTLPLSLHLL